MQWTRSASLALGMMMFLFLAPERSVAQCPMCKTALEQSAEGQHLASAFNTGILFLLCVPFVIVGMVALIVYRQHRRMQMTTCESETNVTGFGDHEARRSLSRRHLLKVSFKKHYHRPT